MTTALYQKEYRQRRKEEGLCTECGKPLDRDGSLCVKCRRKRTDCKTELRHWYQEYGICPRCGKNDLFEDEKTCLECRARNYELVAHSRERLGREHYNTIHSEWSRSEYKKRVESGMCTRCGKRSADYGYKTCGICRAKIRNYRRTKSKKTNRSERAKDGLCYFCDNPVKEGYKVCEMCYQKSLKNLDNDKCREATEYIKRNMKIQFSRNLKNK